MSLSDLFLHHQYRSDRHHLLPDFYLPCLSQVVQDDRAVGFFRSSFLVTMAQGLASLIQFGGKMRLVASPELTEEDIVAIYQGLRQQAEVIAEVVTRELVQELEQMARDRIARLAQLLSQQILEIQLAVPRLLIPGIYIVPFIASASREFPGDGSLSGSGRYCLRGNLKKRTRSHSAGTVF